MNIGIDIRVLAKKARTGVENYTIELLSHLLTIDQKNQYKIFYSGFHKPKLDYFWARNNNLKIKRIVISNRVFDLPLKFLRFPKIDKLLGGVDVFLSPHFLITPLSKGVKRVMIFYDLSFLRFPDFFSHLKRFWHWFVNPKKQAQKADLLITISESTKKDLIDFYDIDPIKIKVVYPGINKKFQPVNQSNPKLLEIIKKYGLSDNFVLYFGTIEPRKNILGLIKAFEYIKQSKNSKILDVDWQGFEGVVRGEKNKALDFSKLKLIIAGSKGWLDKEIFEAAKNSQFKDDIIFIGFVDDDDKPYLYNLAKIFVYPSFFEGFGLPPLEAMACGVPTIVSNKSSLPEVVGDAAIMIDPQNTDELAFAIREVLSNDDLKNLLIKRGLERAGLFDWGKVAKQILQVCE